MSAAILLTAFLLGLLAFFEPCTIATHTLFLARAGQQKSAICYRQILGLWLTRSLLLASLLALAIWFLPAPHWPTGTASLILLGMAMLYLVSRLVYLPIPHLAFYKLLPYQAKLPAATQLGLSLPACTLPLFMITAGMVVVRQDPVTATGAGILFGSGFVLPMLLIARRGMGQAVQDFLQAAAKGSPYLTAVLLIGAALYLYLPHVDLSNQNLRPALAHAGWPGLGLSFLAGFVFSFNPVSFASIPVMLAYVTKAHAKRRALLMGGAFVTGLLLTHVVLGVSAALGGEGVKTVMGREWGLLLGPILILLGLVWPGWLKLRLPWFGMRAQRVSGLWGAFLLAIPFSIAICPFCTPALVVALAASAAIGSASYGFALLLAFAIGRSIPIIIGAWSMGWLESLKVLSRYQRGFETVGGIVLILAGLYLLNEYFLFIEI